MMNGLIRNSLLCTVVFGLLSVSSISQAEQTIEQNPCMYNPAYCGGGQPARRVINIPSRYGAVVYDGDRLILTASDNKMSMRAAKKEAVQECLNYGGTKSSCKIITAARNSCIGLALGGRGKGGVHYGVSRETIQQAENDAMQGCRGMGGEQCFVAYSKCSYDPRYQIGR